jgi:antirestriction protein ArdC
MAAATVDRSVELANQIIAKLEQGIIPWRSVYGGGDTTGGETIVRAKPANVMSLRPYEGRNFLSALTTIGLQGWNSGWFATFKQWQSEDCMVRRGERATSVVSWRQMQTGIDPLTGQPIMEFFQRWFNVFNIEQVEAVSDKGKKFLELSREVIKSPVTVERVPITEVDANGDLYHQIPLLDRIPSAIGCNIHIDAGYVEARYDGVADTIQMPPMVKFISTDAYYTTLLHECVHATMTQERCGRYQSGVVLAENNYAREELVAEFASMLLADKFGTVALYIDNHAGYIQHWIRALRQEPKFLKDIMGDAVKAQRFIMTKLGLNNGGTTELATGDTSDGAGEEEVA